jgi:hypothetical protein
MEALRPVEEILVDYEKHEETNTMVHDGGTSLEWLMYHAAAAGDEDERDKRERERERARERGGVTKG